MSSDTQDLLVLYCQAPNQLCAARIDLASETKQLLNDTVALTADNIDGNASPDAVHEDSDSDSRLSVLMTDSKSDWSRFELGRELKYVEDTEFDGGMNFGILGTNQGSIVNFFNQVYMAPNYLMTTGAIYYDASSSDPDPSIKPLYVQSEPAGVQINPVLLQVQAPRAPTALLYSISRDVNTGITTIPATFSLLYISRESLEQSKTDADVRWTKITIITPWQDLSCGTRPAAVYIQGLNLIRIFAMGNQTLCCVDVILDVNGLPAPKPNPIFYHNVNQDQTGNINAIIKDSSIWLNTTIDNQLTFFNMPIDAGGFMNVDEYPTDVVLASTDKGAGMVLVPPGWLSPSPAQLQ